jgi:hypothetical protein
MLATVFTTSLIGMRYFRSLDYLAGTISRHSFLARLSFYRPIDFINRELPPHSRVLIVGAQMNYGLERPYYSDESWFATKWRRLLTHNDSLDAVNNELKNQGFSHILYSDTLPIFVAEMGLEGTGGMSLISKSEDGAAARDPMSSILRNWSTFALYKKRFLEPVYTDKNGYEVLRIK